MHTYVRRHINNAYTLMSVHICEQVYEATAVLICVHVCNRSVNQTFTHTYHDPYTHTSSHTHCVASVEDVGFAHFDIDS